MRARRLHRASASALLALALLLAGAQALRAQDAAPDAGAGPRATTSSGDSARGARIEFRERRRRAIEQAPQSLRRHAQDLRPIHRRALERSLRRMSEPQRQRFYRDWERMSPRERDQVIAGFSARVEARRQRELPPRLRASELRERLERMSPDERQDFFARAQAWREMDADQRHRMRSRLERFGALSEGEQRALVDEKFARKSPEERARILTQLREASRQLRERGGAEAAPRPAPPAPAGEPEPGG